MRIREVRLQNGISQKELATAIGVAPNTLSQYESGKRAPDFDTMSRISAYFHVSVDYLLGLGREKPVPDEGDGQDDDTLEQEFMRWFRVQSPDRQKDVLFELAKAVSEHDE